MGGIGAPSPGMVFVEKPARFTPIAEWRRLCPDNSPALYRPNIKQRGELSPPIQAPKKNLFWPPTVQFFFTDLLFLRGALISAR